MEYLGYLPPPGYRIILILKWRNPFNEPIVLFGLCPNPGFRYLYFIPTRDRSDLLAGCVQGVLHRTDYSLIVDNESIEPATYTLFDDRLIREENRVRILRHLALLIILF